ncbi:hypothetical protein [Cellvibrio sp. KY-GH-1]|uniref:hypothetical protein n=1 Tax=Cellvibrio sp. KY-GH-1 TaxID=2303332 RepID=UPI0012471A4A|nr:hypothetical protein [Cellvibrio sp. KY-GH-1]
MSSVPHGVSDSLTTISEINISPVGSVVFGAITVFAQLCGLVFVYGLNDVVARAICRMVAPATGVDTDPVL